MRRSFSFLLTALLLATFLGLFIVAGSTVGISRAQGGGPTVTPPGGKSLAAQVGFSDPALANLEARGFNTLGESLEFNAHGRPYRLIGVWQMMQGGGMPIGGVALLYSLASSPRLVWSTDYAAYNGQAPLLYDNGALGEPEPVAVPGNWLGTESVYFAVASAHSGMAWSKYIVHIYELKPDDSVVSALRGAIPRGHVVVRIEPTEDGGPLLTVADLRGEMTMDLPNCCGPRLVRYFAWQDGTLRDVSSQHLDRYQPELGAIIYELTTDLAQPPNFVAARLLELLTIYDISGQREAGWQFANELVRYLKGSDKLAQGTYLESVFLPAMQKLFEAGKPFVAPELIEADPASFPDWYDEAARVP